RLLLNRLLLHRRVLNRLRRCTSHRLRFNVRCSRLLRRSLAQRLIRLHRGVLARLSRRVRRLILVLRRSRNVMLLTRTRGVARFMNTHFTHAFIDVIFGIAMINIRRKSCIIIFSVVLTPCHHGKHLLTKSICRSPQVQVHTQLSPHKDV
ncbi:MAG: hypothetical protein K0S90_3424, partial [Enterobacteriaceae bacterium]|nr:hypothetical protein [Enterobacteriaceae bacterium]